VHEAGPHFAPSEPGLDEIWCYIARDSPEIADRFVDQIKEQFPTLAAYPKLGLPWSDFKPAMRTFPFRNYIIYFREIPRGVEVMRVLHGARDAKRIFG
jgi:toxin ParE1/3/4